MVFSNALGSRHAIRIDARYQYDALDSHGCRRFERGPHQHGMQMVRRIWQADRVDDGVDASRRRAGIAELREIRREDLGMGMTAERLLQFLFRSAHDAIIDAAALQLRRERLADGACRSEDGYFANEATPADLSGSSSPGRGGSPPLRFRILPNSLRSAFARFSLKKRAVLRAEIFSGTVLVFVFICDSSYSKGAEADALKCGSRGFFGAPTWEYGSSGASGSFGRQRFNCAIRALSREFSFMRSALLCKS